MTLRNMRLANLKRQERTNAELSLPAQLSIDVAGLDYRHLDLLSPPSSTITSPTSGKRSDSSTCVCPLGVVVTLVMSAKLVTVGTPYPFTPRVVAWPSGSVFTWCYLRRRIAEKKCVTRRSSPPGSSNMHTPPTQA